MWHILGDQPLNRTTHWAPEPDRRGTYSILSTCIITMGLCVWTAVHLNIPDYKRINLQIWHKAGWLIVGLLAPEIFALAAYQQRNRARRFDRQMKDILGQSKPPSRFWLFVDRCRARVKARFRSDVTPGDTLREPPSEVEKTSITHALKEWTIVHSYYAVMGGYAFNISCSTEGEPDSTDCYFTSGNRSRFTLTPAGLLLLADKEPQLIPKISKDAILDKRKASSLAKFLVCVQAAWFCCQCITRMAFRLPISLLELNTMAHAICTFFIYALWWDKPLDIEQPSLIPLDSEQARRMFAAMYMSSGVGLVRRCTTADGSHPITFAKLPVFGFLEITPLSMALNPPSTLRTDRPSLDPAAGNASGSSAQTATDTNPEQHNSSDTISSSSTTSIVDGDTTERPTIGLEPQSQPDAVGEGDVRLNGDGSASVELWNDNGYIRFNQYFVAHRVSHLDPNGRFSKFFNHRELCIHLDRKDMSCINTAREAFQRYGLKPVRADAYNARMQSVLEDADSDTIEGYNPESDPNPNPSHDLLVVRVSNRPDFRKSSVSRSEIVFMFGLLFAGALYGGIHSLAWNGPFPTRTEKIMWQISCISVGGPWLYLLGMFAVTVVVASIFLAFYGLWRLIGGSTRDRLKRIFRGPVTGIGIVLLFVVILPLGLALSIAIIGFVFVYIFGRVYLVVECFISLAYLPDGAFDIPQWSNYFAHIS